MSENPAKGVVWDLSDLYQSMDDPKLAKDIQLAKDKALAFEKKYKPILDNLSTGKEKSNPIPELLKELEVITEISTKPIVYAMLLHAAHTNDQKMGAFYNKVQLELTEIRHHLRFWDLQWTSLDESVVKPLVEDKQVAFYKHYLETMRLYADHLLSEPEEKILDIKANTGGRAFSRLFDELVNNIPFTIQNNGTPEKKTEGEVLALLYSPDRKQRQKGHESLTKGLQDNGRVITYIFNMIAQDHKSSNELRDYDHPMKSRNMANEISMPVVESLIKSVKGGYSLVERYYNLKKKLLGLDALYDYDRYAPVLPDTSVTSWEECRQIVSNGYHEFDKEFGTIADLFFDKNWIDAEVREGKRGGAFCCSSTSDLHPWVFTNYTGKQRDVMTVAHELGHGIHQYLARPAGIFEADAPLTLAETASVFGEVLIFDKLKKQTTDPKQKLGLLCGKIEDMFATVFRQIVMTDFEAKLHEGAVKQGELSTEQISQFWLEANEPMHGNAVELTEEYKSWWMYIPHFIHTPFYCYAYSFAQLLVLALYKKYQEDPADFVPKFKKMLSLGGSRKPEEICAIMGLDIQDPAFWQTGLSVIEEMVTEAENLVVASSS